MRWIRTGWVLWLALSGSMAAQAADQTPYFTLHRVGDGVWAAISVPGSHAGGNSGFIIGSDSVLVVDTFEEPAAAQALLKAIHAKTALPVRYVVNTHYHLDHVGGNGVYRSAGAVILAQRNVRAWEHIENLKFFGDKITPAQKETVESYVLPDVVYDGGIEIYLGSRKVIVRVLPGHTGGDSVVVVPDAGVVFTGDLFWNHCLPNLIDANTRQQVTTNDVFLEDYPRASFVPGHGAVADAGDVRAFRDYLAALRARVGAARSKQLSGATLVDAVMPALKRTYGGWKYFDYFARQNIEQTAAELAGSKRLPVPLPAAGP
ncbi:MAG TPA: MBL fold metallo-hydrolase [Gammaproteobacteria bacterium]|nr:MBL fold metallo-hydrolase [Gammaproteobacteria bacterium]